MRTALLVVAVLLCSGESFAKAAMPANVPPGHIAWFDITTTDIAKSKEFYAGLFGWKYTAVAGTDQAVEIVSGGAPIGTLRGADGKISGFNGVVYVKVADIKAACARAKELGGTVVPGFPFNLPEGRGAIAVAVDPSGHPVGMYSKMPLPAAEK